jgi:hypothetical protein
MVATERDTTTVRIGRTTHEKLRKIADQTGEQIAAVLARAVEQEERRLFWQRFHAAVDRLRSDPVAWAAYQDESRELEGTLMDGLDPEEDWSEQFEAPPEAFEPIEEGHAAGPAR